MKIEFEGNPAQIREQVAAFLKVNGGDDDVTIKHEFVRSDSNWNELYIVTLINATPRACTCKDFHYQIRKKTEAGRTNPTHICKHMRQAEVRFRPFPDRR